MTNDTDKLDCPQWIENRLMSEFERVEKPAVKLESNKLQMPESCSTCPILPICVAQYGKGNCPTVWAKLQGMVQS